MALSDRWSRATIRNAVRRELLDPTEKWWTDSELSNYIGAWQDRLQEQFEFVWGSCSATTSLSTFTLSALATDILRLDAVCWNGRRLVGRPREELDLLNRNWRNANPGTPKVVYQDDLKTFNLWPEPDVAGTLLLEYPQVLTFAVDTSTMQVPAWTKYSALNYCLYRAYSRFGPNQDLNIAARRKSRWNVQLRKYKTTVTNFFPTKYLTLRPGGQYEKQILQPETPERDTL